MAGSPGTRLSPTGSRTLIIVTVANISYLQRRNGASPG